MENILPTNWEYIINNEVFGRTLFGVRNSNAWGAGLIFMEDTNDWRIDNGSLRRNCIHDEIGFLEIGLREESTDLEERVLMLGVIEGKKKVFRDTARIRGTRGNQEISIELTEESDISITSENIHRIMFDLYSLRTNGREKGENVLDLTKKPDHVEVKEINTLPPQEDIVEQFRVASEVGRLDITSKALTMAADIQYFIQLYGHNENSGDVLNRALDNLIKLISIYFGEDVNHAEENELGYFIFRLGSSLQREHMRQRELKMTKTEHNFEAQMNKINWKFLLPNFELKL